MDEPNKDPEPSTTQPPQTWEDSNVRPIGETIKDLAERVVKRMEYTREVSEEEVRASIQREENYRRSKAWDAIAGERGARYATCTLGSFKCDHPKQQEAIDEVTAYAKSLPSALEFGKGILFYGPRGTGKDHLMMAVLRAAVLYHGFTARWGNGQDLFGDIRDGIESGESEGQLVARLAKPQFLAISDPLPVFGDLTAHQANMLFRIIDRRYSRGVPTLVTLNVANGAEAEKRMGGQIVDRLRHDALVVLCNWPSFRKAAD